MSWKEGGPTPSQQLTRGRFCFGGEAQQHLREMWILLEKHGTEHGVR